MSISLQPTHHHIPLVFSSLPSIQLINNPIICQKNDLRPSSDKLPCFILRRREYESRRDISCMVEISLIS